ncbi:hypothetical protein C4D60_Mb01t18580 [Musa balbisiana]|uniref:Syntaxin N-terminal domain-containing protein n=1 Tax=Musa balbisiana TaxID=52838 RepID=A0A4S8JNI3_MUSBA|nr:hypothetical protein C4D60_Mb01t18580 [Musa balbisiana]
MSFQDLESGRPLTARRDPSNGRQDPTQAIVAGLFQITTAVRNFERLVNTIGTPKDTPELREKLYAATEADDNSNRTLEQRAVLAESRRQEILLLDNEIVFNEAIIEEREQGIQEIQQQIGQIEPYGDKKKKTKN